MNDPDIQLTLENSNFLYPSCRPHFFVTAEGTYEPEIVDVLSRNRNLELLTYSNDDGTHSNLLVSLQKLRENVENRKLKIAESQTW